MENSKPKELTGIEFAGRETVSASLIVKKAPDPKEKGFINLSLAFRKPNLLGGTPEKGPTAFVMEVEAACKAWSGEPPQEKKQPPEENLLMTCQVKVAVHYRVTRPDLKEQDIVNTSWFYHPQLTILATDALRSLLKDTQFNTIPIGLPGAATPEENVTQNNTSQ